MAAEGAPRPHPQWRRLRGRRVHDQTRRRCVWTWLRSGGRARRGRHDHDHGEACRGPGHGPCAPSQRPCAHVTPRGRADPPQRMPSTPPWLVPTVPHTQRDIDPVSHAGTGTQSGTSSGGALLERRSGPSWSDRLTAAQPSAGRVSRPHLWSHRSGIHSRGRSSPTRATVETTNRRQGPRAALDMWRHRSSGAHTV